MVRCLVEESSADPVSPLLATAGIPKEFLSSGERSCVCCEGCMRNSSKNGICVSLFFVPDDFSLDSQTRQFVWVTRH